MIEVRGKCPTCGSYEVFENEVKDIEFDGTNEVSMVIGYVCTKCDERYEAIVKASFTSYTVI